jgi:hypothetical protein
VVRGDQDERVAVRDIIQCTIQTRTPHDGSPFISPLKLEFVHPDFHEALPIANTGSAVSSSMLELWLSAQQNRVVSHCRILLHGLIGDTMMWQLWIDPEVASAAA